MRISAWNIIRRKTWEEESSQCIHSEFQNKFLYVFKPGKCDSDINLITAKLAKSLQVNREYLSSAILKFVGESYVNIIRIYRIKETVQILEDMINEVQTKLSMPEVTRAYRFKSASTFNPGFKKVIEVTLKEFKRNFLQ